MRKTYVIAAFVFVLALIAGLVVAPAQAAGGGGGTNCYYTCSCEGTPLRCCTTSSGTFCTVTDVIQCPQIYNC